MGDMITMRLEGLELHFAAIENLDKKTTRRVVPKAVRAGARPQVQATRQAAPVQNRFLRRSLGLVIRRYQGSVYAVIGQERGKTFKRKKRVKSGGISGRNMAAPIHLVDQPVQPHEIRARGPWLAIDGPQGMIYRRRVQHPGHRGARFMAAAARNSQQEAERAFEAKFVAELEREGAI